MDEAKSGPRMGPEYKRLNKMLQSRFEHLDSLIAEFIELNPFQLTVEVISLRPPEVDEKLRFGDFEIDTIIGKNRKGAVMTINDRCTKIVFIRRLTGKEFARHKEIAKVLDVQFFFARPYHSWERGANENTNGLARQYIPKGTDFEDLTDEYIAEVEWKLNHRPKKSLGYLTPLEYFKKIYKFDFGSRCTSN